MRRARRSRAGLTLLELLVALVVTAAAAALGYAALATTADAHARATRDGDPVASAAARRAWLRATIAAARVGAPGAGTAFEGSDAVPGMLRHTGPAHDALLLVSRDETGADVWVRLHVDDDAATPERGVVAEITPFPRRPGDRARRLVIDPDATSLDIAYLSPVAPRRWLAEWRAEGILPAAVRLRLAGARVHPVLVLPLTVPVGASR